MACRRKPTFGLVFWSAVKSEYYTGLQSEEKMLEIFEAVPFFNENFSMMERIKGVPLYVIA